MSGDSWPSRRRPPDQVGRALRRLRPVGLAPRAVDLLPLLRVRGLTELWTCEAADADWARLFDVELHSLEESSGTRRRWRGTDVDRLLPALRARAGSGRRHLLVPYALTDGVLCGPAGGRAPRLPAHLAVARPPELTDKISARRWLRGLGVPVPDSAVVGRTGGPGYRTLRRRLGSPMVLQAPAGSGGVRTFLVGDRSDYEQARSQLPTRALASSYAGDTTLNLHGLVARDGGVTVGRPALQLSGLSQAGSGFGEYAGSDFAAPWLHPERLLHACASIVRRVGASMAAKGYAGIFGIDFAASDAAVTVLEVNSRVQASTWLLGELERESGEVPMLCRHVLPDLRCGPPGPWPEAAAPAGCSLVVRHTGRAGRVGGTLRPGVYVRRGTLLERRRTGVGPLSCGPGEIAIADLPRPGTVVHPGAALGRIAARFSLADPDGRSLTAVGAALVAALRASVPVLPDDGRP